MIATPIRAIIVDDEPLARRRVNQLLEPVADFQVVGMAGNGIEALKLCSDVQPDVVFLDIQMPGIDGIGVATQLPMENRPLVVFVTAFDQFAANAFDLDAVDFLLKPYDQDRFDATIARVRRRFNRKPITTVPPIEHLLSTAAGRVRLLQVETIERIEAAGNYVEVTMAGGAVYLVRHSISALADELPCPPFVQIHRSSIIRVDRIVNIATKGHGDASLRLADGSNTTLSRRYRAGLTALLANKSRPAQP